MKEGTEDLVFNELAKRTQKVVDRLLLGARKTKPFRKEPVKTEDILYAFDTLEYDEAMTLMEQFGVDNFMSLRDEVMRKTRRK